MPDGILATSYAFFGPTAVAPDTVGGFYFSAEGGVYRVAVNGTAWLIRELEYGAGTAIDRTGNLYLAETSKHRIRKVAADGTINTVAGTGTSGFSGDGGLATAAQLSSPEGLAIDDAGNLFIADLNNQRIRKVTPEGVIHTVAGTGNRGYSPDGVPATQAHLNVPRRVAVDSSGSFYFSDSLNYRVRKVGVDGIIQTVAGREAPGDSGDGGPASLAYLGQPQGLAIDRSGNLFIADYQAARIRKVTPSGTITTVAGTGVLGYSGDGGPAFEAQLFQPRDIGFDDSRNLYIADAGNSAIRRVGTDGVIHTLAGTGFPRFSGDGGLAISAQLWRPEGLAADTKGNVYIADRANGRIRKVTPDGRIQSLAGKIPSAGGGPILSIAADSSGNVYFTEYQSHVVKRISLNGTVELVGRFYYPFSVAVDSSDNLYVHDNRGTYRVNKSGESITLNSLVNPGGIAIDTGGNVYVSDTSNHVVYKTTTSGVTTRVAGKLSAPQNSRFSGDGGPATDALLLGPAAITVDTAGNLYIGDAGNYRIRRVGTDGIITTIAGSGTSGYSGDGGDALNADLNGVSGLAVDTNGNVIISDFINNVIRKLPNVALSNYFTYTASAGGTVSFNTVGTSGPLSVGYVELLSNPETIVPDGLAIFGLRQNGVLVSEASVPAVRAIQSGRLYAEISSSVSTGLAVANPNQQPVTLSFYFTDANGDIGADSITIPASAQIAKFLHQAPFSGHAGFSGTFTFVSTLPVAVVALRGRTNERGEFLVTTLPVQELSITMPKGIAILPHLSVGGGWTTQIILLNPTGSTLTGSILFLDLLGGPLAVSVHGMTLTNFRYSIPPKSSQAIVTSGLAEAPITGSVQVRPDSTSDAPASFATFSFRKDGITVSEAGIPAGLGGTAFRIYAGIDDGVETGVAIANLAATATSVRMELLRGDGTSTGRTGVLTISPFGQVAKFLSEIAGLRQEGPPTDLVLRVTSTNPVSLIGLRGRYNERSDFLITTIFPIDEASLPASSKLVFPHFPAGGGYSTRFIFFNSSSTQQTTGTGRFVTATGTPLYLPLQR